MEYLEADLHKTYKNFKLALSVQMPGQVLGVLGASGCGKSMMLKMIAGIEQPADGYVRLCGRTLFDRQKKVNLPPQKRKTGYLFQDYALFPNMTIKENIAAGIRERGTDKDAVVCDLMRSFGLTGLEDQYPAQVSGGQKQRAALARMLASKPDMLLLDEPFAAVDAYLKEELQIELKERIRGFAGPVIIVSHDRDEIYKLCPHMMVMDCGKNLICKETAEVFKNPRFREAARLTGCKNISRARRVGAQEIEAVEWGMRLHVTGSIPKNLQYAGIRAHDFVPLTGGETKRNNVITVCEASITQAPFERNIQFKYAANPSGKLWMKQNGTYAGIPEKVYVPEESILLLE